MKSLLVVSELRCFTNIQQGLYSIMVTIVTFVYTDEGLLLNLINHSERQNLDFLSNLQGIYSSPLLYSLNRDKINCYSRGNQTASSVSAVEATDPP